MRQTTVALGAGATAELATRTGAHLLDQDRSARPSTWTATYPDRGTHQRHLAQPEPANH